MSKRNVEQHYQKQERLCAICGDTENLKRDHSHSSNRCRGWLCHRCNIALGWVESICPWMWSNGEIEMAEKLLAYMKYWGVKNQPGGVSRNSAAPYWVAV